MQSAQDQHRELNEKYEDLKANKTEELEALFRAGDTKIDELTAAAERVAGHWRGTATELAARLEEYAADNEAARVQVGALELNELTCCQRNRAHLASGPAGGARGSAAAGMRRRVHTLINS